MSTPLHSSHAGSGLCRASEEQPLHGAVSQQCGRDDARPTSWAACFATKCIDPVDLPNLLCSLRSQGLKIATANGSFDLFHAGHLHFLYEASLAADHLIVALNTDSSIQRYKSTKRPIISLQHRLEMVAALAFVDYVTWFDELDPRALLEVIRPEVHVNGIEYGAACIESEVVTRHGGRLHLVERKEGLATSSVIQRIIQQCD